MALFDLHPASETALGARIGALRAGLADWRRRRAVYVRTRDELLSLSDRDLTDLGIDRAEVPTVAAQAAQRA